MNFKSNHPTNPLSPTLERLEALNNQLGANRAAYLLKEASRKHFEAKLISIGPGKSHAERQVSAMASKEWLEFHLELARLEAVYEFQKLKLTILEKEWQSTYLCLKLDAGLIKKQD